ncbi:MAG: serine/threonine-protein kinase [Myxococcota bacterium]
MELLQTEREHVTGPQMNVEPTVRVRTLGVSEARKQDDGQEAGQREEMVMIALTPGLALRVPDDACGGSEARPSDASNVNLNDRQFVDSVPASGAAVLFAGVLGPGESSGLKEHDLLQAVVETHVGRVIDAVDDDALVVLFESVDQCLAAAEELQITLSGFNRQLSEGATTLRVAVGVHSVIPEDSLSLEAAVAVARAVHSMGSEGEILATDRVVAATFRRHFESIGPVYIGEGASRTLLHRLRWRHPHSPMARVQPRLIDSRYLISESLGRGPWGVVHDALDTRLGLHVVLKLMHPLPLANEETRQNWHRCIRKMAALRHPSIVRVCDCSMPHANELYYVSERQSGADLYAVMERCGVPPLTAALGCAVTLCDVLEWAHERDVVHGGLTPSNVLVDHRWSPSITDFGLWHLAHTTNEFLPPEQRCSPSLEPSVDVYALAAIVAFMITGKSPEVFSRSCTEEAMACFPPTVPRQLNDVLARALSTNSNARPTLCEVGDSLRRAIIDLSPEKLYDEQHGASVLGSEEDVAVTVEDALLDEAAHGSVPHEDTLLNLRGESLALEAEEKGFLEGAGSAVLEARTVNSESECTGTGVYSGESTAMFEATHFVDTQNIDAADGTTQRTRREIDPPNGQAFRYWASAIIAVLLLVATAYLATHGSEPRPTQVVATEVIPVLEQGPAAVGVGKRAEDAPEVADRRGHLILETQPWADVYIDRQKVGSTPSLQNLTLNAGSHLMTLIHPGHKPHIEHIQIAEGEELRRHIKLLTLE